MKTNKGFTLIEVVLAIAIGLIIIAGVSIGYSYSKSSPTPKPNPFGCSTEARICPDGSIVVRVGSKCEFAPCPSPTPTPLPNGEEIIKKVGEKEGSFFIQKINSASVDGLWYQAYPVATENGTPKTLHIGDDIGYACEGISEKLINIDFSAQTITFNKVTSKPPLGGCPI